MGGRLMDKKIKDRIKSTEYEYEVELSINIRYRVKEKSARAAEELVLANYDDANLGVLDKLVEFRFASAKRLGG